MYSGKLGLLYLICFNITLPGTCAQPLSATLVVDLWIFQQFDYFNSEHFTHVAAVFPCLMASAVDGSDLCVDDEQGGSSVPGFFDPLQVQPSPPFLLHKPVPTTNAYKCLTCCRLWESFAGFSEP